MNEFLQRVKERKLVQWTVAYVAAAFALLQGIDIVAQRFGWPEQTMRLVIIALSVGLFVTLVLAWYHGERGAQRVTGTELLILALLLALGGGFLWRFVGASRERSVRPAPTASSPAPAAIPEKSIAVLPFENLSDEKANAYFADGIQDEILTRLSKIADLKVISRTSTLKYKSAPENLREVGSQLGVAHLLEGSVQKAGDQVHITVQLINATTDAHLWAESYDRELKNIFSVEGEVAGAIAEALKAKLTGSEKKAIAEKPTQNAAAYEAYLRGLALEHNEYSYSESKQVADDYAEAVRLDPTFARA
jgi:TolB-like protein